MTEPQDLELAKYELLELEEKLLYLSKIKSENGEVLPDFEKFLRTFKVHVIDNDRTALLLVAENDLPYLVHLDQEDDDWQRLPMPPFETIRFVGQIDGSAAFVIKRGGNAYESIVYDNENGDFLGLTIGDLSSEEWKKIKANGLWPEDWETPELELFERLELEAKLDFIAKVKGKTPEFDTQLHLYKYLRGFPWRKIDSGTQAMFLLAKNKKHYLVHLDDGVWQEVPFKPFDDLWFIGLEEEEGCPMFVTKRGAKSYEGLKYNYDSGKFIGISVGELLKDEFELIESNGEWPETWERPFE